jgi:tetratricopeptide (TPR) repeat protein
MCLPHTAQPISLPLTGSAATTSVMATNVSVSTIRARDQFGLLYGVTVRIVQHRQGAGGMKKSRKHKQVQRARPTISLCVIARDEEALIGDCLASARAFVDEIMVLDTGSTDRTAEIARHHGARVETFQWRDDFAAARNAAIDVATGDWILMLDADERLQPASGQVLRKFIASGPSGAIGFALRIESLVDIGSDEFRVSFHPRLFRRMDDLRYAGTIHEDLIYVPDPARLVTARLATVCITHLGYRPDLIESRNKFERNRRLLMSAVAAGADDPLPWYYLGMDRVSADQPAEAAEYFRQSLSRSANRPHWSSVDVYAQLVWAYIKLEDDERLKSIVDEAERTRMLSAGARANLATDLVQRGRYAEAVQQLLNALQPDQPVVQVSRPGIGGWLTRMDLARIYAHLGNAQAAGQQVELVLADPEVRQRSDVMSAAVRLAIQVGHSASMSRCLEVVPQPAEADFEGTMLLLELRALASPASKSLRALSSTDRAVTLGDWQAAADAALQLVGQTMADAARLLFVAARLEAAGAPAAALKLLEHLYNTQPALPQLHIALTRVLAGLGRYDDAMAANEILQQLLAAQQLAPAAA